MYQTNVCRVKCKFCAFAKTRKQEDSYTLTADELVEDALAQHQVAEFTEIHLVNGENPHVDLEFYAEILRKLRVALPDVHLKFYTASEIHHMSKLEGCSHEEVLRVLKDAGLGSMPGGGAEIFADRVRQLIAPGKEPAEDWFDVHDTAHRLGITTQCTMLYGHVETYEERIDHLMRLREQQDKTGGFLSFIPARLPSGEHGLRAARLQVHDRRRRPEGDRGVTPDARQHRAHQGVLDHDGHADGAACVALRRERRAGHGRARADLPGRRRNERNGTEDLRARAVHPRRGPHSRAARLDVQRAAQVGRVIKLGRISYVNMAPIFYRVGMEVEEIQGVPTELNRMLIEGELDTAPISSIEYARNADKLRLLPRLCVASEGAVDSIQLVTREAARADARRRRDARVGDVRRADEGAAARVRRRCRSRRTRPAMLTRSC